MTYNDINRYGHHSNNHHDEDFSNNKSDNSTKKDDCNNYNIDLSNTLDESIYLSD